MRAVLERDFLAEVSRPRFFWFRTVVAVVVAAVILITLNEEMRRFRDQPDVAAREIFLFAGFTLLLLLALLTPASVIGAVLEERLRDTLPLVLASPCSAVGFAAAKGIARAASVFGWALAALVPVVTVVLLGGISGAEILDFLILGVAVVLELAGWGIWLSGGTRRFATAAVLAYLLPFLRWAVTILAAMFLLLGPPRPADPSAAPGHVNGCWLALATTPMPACVRLGDRREYDDLVRETLRGPDQSVRVGPVLGRPIASIQPTLWFLASSSVIFLLGILLAGRRLRTEAEPRTPLLSRFRWFRRRLRAPPETGNPVSWKEGRLLNTAASRPMYYTILATMIAAEGVLLLVVSLAGLSSRDLVELAMGFTSGHAVLLSPVAAVVAAASFSHEKSTGALDLLRVTELTPREISHGKAAGALRAAGLLSLVPFVHLFGMTVGGVLHPVVALLGMLDLVVTVLFWVAVGMAAGIFTFRVRGAVSLAITTYVVAVFGVPLLAIAADEWWDARDFPEFLLGTFPPAQPFMLMEAAALRLQQDGGSRYADYAYHWSNSHSHWRSYHVAAILTALALLAGALLLYRLLPRFLAWRLERERVAG